jgi:hypothetical protein
MNKAKALLSLLEAQLYHGSKTAVDHLELGNDGGIHLGTKAQAKMRNSKHVYAVEVSTDVDRFKRERDTGGNWKGKIQKAKKAGYDGIVYLNRYEGIDKDQYFKLLDKGWTGDKLDSLSDKEFKKLLPGMEDSYIVFNPKDVRIIGE